MAWAGVKEAKASICCFVAPKVALLKRCAARFKPKVPLNSGNGIVVWFQETN